MDKVKIDWLNRDLSNCFGGKSYLGKTSVNSNVVIQKIDQLTVNKTQKKKIKFKSQNLI